LLSEVEWGGSEGGKPLSYSIGGRERRFCSSSSGRRTGSCTRKKTGVIDLAGEEKKLRIGRLNQNGKKEKEGRRRSSFGAVEEKELKWPPCKEMGRGIDRRRKKEDRRLLRLGHRITEESGLSQGRLAKIEKKRAIVDRKKRPREKSPRNGKSGGEPLVMKGRGVKTGWLKVAAIGGDCRERKRRSYWGENEKLPPLEIKRIRKD